MSFPSSLGKLNIIKLLFQCILHANSKFKGKTQQIIMFSHFLSESFHLSKRQTADMMITLCWHQMYNHWYDFFQWQSVYINQLLVWVGWPIQKSWWPRESLGWGHVVEEKHFWPEQVPEFLKLRLPHTQQLSCHYSSSLHWIGSNMALPLSVETHLCRPLWCFLWSLGHCTSHSLSCSPPEHCSGACRRWNLQTSKQNCSSQ